MASMTPGDTMAVEAKSHNGPGFKPEENHLYGKIHYFLMHIAMENHFYGKTIFYHHYPLVI